MNKNYIPRWLLLILIISVIGSLLTYFLISNSPKIEDLFINLAASLFEILITLFIIDRIIKYYEKKEWDAFEKIISNQIIDIIFTLCNYSNISSKVWEQYLQIFKEELDTKNKIAKYIEFFRSSEIEIDYLKQIVVNEHLIEFFTNGYKGIHQSLDDIFRLYSFKLSAEQSIQIINLKTKVTILLSIMNRFYTTNFAIKELNIPLEDHLLNDFKENVKETIFVASELLETV
jgi:hypothetical protein